MLAATIVVVKVLVLGATGATGSLVVQEALRRGHGVRALARDPRNVALGNGVCVVCGDVLDAGAVADATKQQDAVIWAISARRSDRRSSRLNLCTEGTRNVLAAMSASGVRRLVAITSWGLGDGRDRLPLFVRRVVLPLALGPELADKEEQEALIRQSDLDWTIVRPSRLTNRSATGSFRVAPRLAYRSTASIPRRDLARFLLDQLTDRSFLHSTVEVSR